MIYQLLLKIKKKAIPFIYLILIISSGFSYANDLDEFYKIQSQFQKLLYDENKFKEALNIKDEYLSIAEDQLKSQSYKKLARVYADIAILSGELADYNESIYYWDILLEVYEKNNDQKNYLTTLTNRGVTYELTARLDEALEDHKQAIAIAENYYGLEAIELIPPLNNYAKTLAVVGDHSNSIKYYSRSLELTKSFEDGGINEGIILLNLGVSFSYLENYDLAEKYYEASLEIIDKHYGPDSISSANILASLGNVKRVKKNYEESNLLLKKSYDIREESLGPDHPDTLTSILHLAGLLAEQQKFNKAIELADDVAERFKNIYGDDHIRSISNHINLSDWYMKQFNYDKALYHAEQSLMIGENILSPLDPELAKVYRNMASLNLVFTQEPSIKNTEDPSLTQSKYLIDHLEFTKRAANIMSYHINQHKVNETAYKNEGYERFIIQYITALNSYNSSFGSELFLTERNKRGFHIEFSSEINLNTFKGMKVNSLILGSPAEKAGVRPNDIIIQVNKTAISEPLDFYNLITDFLPGRKIYLKINRDDQIIEFEYVNELVIPVMKNKKDSSLITSEMWLGMNDKQSINETFKLYQTLYDIEASEALRKSISRLDSGLYNERIKEMQNAIIENTEISKKKISRIDSNIISPDLMKEENEIFKFNTNKIKRIEKGLRDDYPEYFDLVSPKIYAIEDIQNLLEKDEAIVTYLYHTNTVFGFFDMNYTHIWVITKDDQRVYFIDELPPEALIENISDMSEILNPYNFMEFNFDVSYNLYEKIFLPIEDFLQNKNEVFIIPYGDLYRIPFTTLITKENYSGSLKKAPWLINDYAISILPSLANLELIKKKKKDEILKTHIGFGDPILANYMNDQYRGFIADSGEISDLISLPETRGELEAISNYLGVDNGRNYFAEEATEFNLKSIDLSNINLISFATHALVSGELENLNEPGLILTPPSNPTMNDDGILTASEITKLDLSNTNFVILSACNTTAGSDSDAEELSGLSRAFFYSGANSILASHWPVVSEIAPMITVGIFKNLYESDYTITKSEAMRLSIMDYIKNSDEKLLHPSYWAAFSLIGG